MRQLAFIVILAAFAAHGAGVGTAKFGDLGLNDNVVTSVDLSGLSEAETDPTVPAWAKAAEPPAHVPYETDDEMPGWMMVFSPVFLSALQVDGTATFDGDIEAGLPGSSVWLPGGWSQLRTGTRDGYVESQTLPQYLSANISPISGQIATIGSQVNTIASTLNAEDAKFEITNYNSQVHMPEASFSVKVKNEQTGSNEWVIAWRELTRWNWFLVEVWDPCTNALWAALGNKSEKEYAFYDGVTGEPAPDGFFWIAQPRVAICAGMSYQRYVDGEGAIWVLESNGMIADLNGTTNGFFRITDEENNVQFEIIKGNRRTLGAAPRTMKQEVMGVTHFFTSYATTNAVAPPVAKFCRDIGVQTPKWYAEDDQDCPMNVSWTDKGSGIYEVEWWQKSNEPSMFLVAEYETGGATRIVQRAPVEMQKLYIGGVEYTIGTATIDGKTVLTLTP